MKNLPWALALSSVALVLWPIEQLTHHAIACVASAARRISYLLISVSRVGVEAGIEDPFILLGNGFHLKHMRGKR